MTAAAKHAPPFHARVIATDGKMGREWYLYQQQQSAATGGTEPLPVLTPLEMVDLYLTSRHQ